MKIKALPIPDLSKFQSTRKLWLATYLDTSNTEDSRVVDWESKPTLEDLETDRCHDEVLVSLVEVEL